MRWSKHTLDQEAVYSALIDAGEWLDADPSGGAQADDELPMHNYRPLVELWIDKTVLNYNPVTDNPESTALLQEADKLWNAYLLDEACIEDSEKLDAIEEAWDSQDDLNRLPPIVIRQTGTILDGWHRIVTAIAHGQETSIPAIVMRWGELS